jgi:MFS family permease
MNRLREWLGLERNIVVMLAAIIIIGMGEELWQRFIPKYLEFLGASAWAIALYGTLKDFLDAVYQYPGGWLADRLGRGAALILFTGIAIVGFAIYLISPSWQLIIIGTIFVMAWNSLTLPAFFAIIGDSLPSQRRAIGFSVQSILKRIPMIVAPPIGGWLIAQSGLAFGIKIGLIATIVLAMLSLIIIRRGYRESTPAVKDTLTFKMIWRAMDANLKRLLFADCVARWAEGIPKVFIVLYVIDIMKLSSLQFGWLTSMQMFVAAAIYIPIAKLADRFNRKPFVILTFGFFALFPAVLGFAQNLAGVMLAFVIAGLREVGEPARKALIVDLADANVRGRAVGVYYLIRGLVVFPASLIGGWLWRMDAQLPFFVAAIVGAIGLFTYSFGTKKS